MNKYQAVSIVGVLQVIYMIAVISISVLIKNYWLLFLLLLAGTKDCEERILDSS